MIRAFLLRLLGFSPVWEVRSVSMKSGKDIPGERKFRGSYAGARRYFKDHPAPPDHELRLQALLVTKSRYFPTIDDEPLSRPSEFKPGAALMMSEDESREAVQQLKDAPPMSDWKEEPGAEVPRGTDDAVPGIDSDHECDAEGPLEWEDIAGGYFPSCSICGKLN